MSTFIPPGNQSSDAAEAAAEALFYEALELAPSQREAFLSRVCGGNVALRREVGGYLERYAQSGEFLTVGRSAPGLVRTELARLKPEEAGDWIGQYKLLQQIGEGAFGIVWMAEQEKPVRRRVALKIVKLGMDTKEVIARFEQERQALAMMDHPNIAKVFDAGATPLGRPFFAMELVKGVKITEYCDQAKLTTADRLALFIKVCNAIQHAHQKGIIHRDLKPSNILVTLHDGVPVPKVIDFGVAKATQQQRLTDLTLFTRFEQMVGTPLYMSPEQAELSGLDIDTRSDIYSLGILLYELLTGRTPFDPEELMKKGLDEIRRVIREQEPQKPSTFVSTMAFDLRTNVAQDRRTDIAKLTGQIRGDLDWIVMKALEKDRNRRYETPNGLARDIERHLSSEPVHARPPSAIYRLRRFARRNRIAFLAGTAVFLALLIGLGVASWMFVKERIAREEATAAKQEQIHLREVADSDRTKAEKESKKSSQVSQFLTDMLNGVGPSVALGRDTTLLREILEKTEVRLGKDLKDQPEVEADLRTILGNVYGSLGKFEQARSMHSEALEIRQKLFGEESEAVCASLINLGEILGAQGRISEAEDFFRTALAVATRRGGSRHPYVAVSLSNLGLILMGRGEFADAERMFREALANVGQKAPNYGANIRSYQASLLEKQKRWEEAEAARREVLEFRRKNFGNEHPCVASDLENLGFTLQLAGKIQEAEVTFREAIGVYQRTAGSDHPDLGKVLHLLAHVLEKQDRLPEAEQLYRESWAIIGELPGHEASCLALLLEGQKRLPEAEEIRREVLARRKRLRGDHPSVAEGLYSLAANLEKQKKFEEAEVAAQEALAMRRNLLEDSHADTVRSVAQVCSLLGKLERHLESAELLSVEIPKVRGTGNANLAEYGNMLHQHAGILFEQGSYAEAEPLYRELIEHRTKRLRAGHENVIPAKALLARVLSEWAWSDHRRAAESATGSREDSLKASSEARMRHERALEAEGLLREVVASPLGGNASASWQLNVNRSRLGGALVSVAVTAEDTAGDVRRAKLAEAESLLLQSNTVLQSSMAHPKYKRGALMRIVRLYEAWDKPEEAAKWREYLANLENLGRSP